MADGQRGWMRSVVWRALGMRHLERELTETARELRATADAQAKLTKASGKLVEAQAHTLRTQVQLLPRSGKRSVVGGVVVLVLSFVGLWSAAELQGRSGAGVDLATELRAEAESLTTKTTSDTKDLATSALMVRLFQLQSADMSNLSATEVLDVVASVQSAAGDAEALQRLRDRLVLDAAAQDVARQKVVESLFEDLLDPKFLEEKAEELDRADELRARATNLERSARRRTTASTAQFGCFSALLGAAVAWMLTAFLDSWPQRRKATDASQLSEGVEL